MDVVTNWSVITEAIKFVRQKTEEELSTPTTKDKETRMNDYNMLIAYDHANTLGPPPRLATELKNPSIRAHFLHFVDTNIIKGDPIFDILEDKRIIRDSFLTDIANKTEPLLKSIIEPIARINLTLRLWVGCIEAAKIIRETEMDFKDENVYEKKITPEDREKYCAEIVTPKSLADPIYLAGAEGAPIFRKVIRHQEICSDGLTDDCVLMKYLKPYLGSRE